MRAKEFNEGSDLVKVRKPATKHKPTLLHSMMSEMFKSIIDEDSSAGEALRGSPYADHLIPVIHKKMDLSHKLKWEEKTRIDWSDISDVNPNFVLIAGTNGTAAVRWNGSTRIFEAYIAGKDGIQTASTYHTEEHLLLEKIKEHIGTLNKFFVPKPEEPDDYPSGSLYDVTGEKLPSSIQRSRKERRDVPPGLATADNKMSKLVKPSAGLSDSNISAIRNKLKPLLVKYIKTALADVKGVANTAMKSDAFDIASKKLEHASRLHRILAGLDNPSAWDQSGADLNSKINNAIIMTAGHYYSDMTGDIRKSTEDKSRYTSENLLGPYQLITDIANGDDKKLATVMHSIKQELLHPLPSDR